MESRFVKQISNLRSYLRRRGAVIDVRKKSIQVDVDTLNRKELEKLKELERWGYEVNKPKQELPLFRDMDAPFTLEEEDSFIAFADEIMAMYY